MIKYKIYTQVYVDICIYNVYLSTCLFVFGKADHDGTSTSTKHHVLFSNVQVLIFEVGDICPEA